MKIKIVLNNGSHIIVNGNIAQIHKEINRDKSNNGLFEWLLLGDATVRRGDVKYAIEFNRHENDRQSEDYGLIQKTEIKDFEY